VSPDPAVVDVVVVTMNLKDVVLRCLEHLGDETVASVTVVDNASTDGTDAAIRERFPDVNVDHLDERISLAAAYNRGAAAGGAPYVLFLNNDIFALPGSVATLVEALERRPGAVAAMGRLVDPGGDETQTDYQPRPFPTLRSFAASLVGIEDRWKTNPWTGGHRRRPLDQRQTVPIEQAVGACLLVRREPFVDVGGWDEQYALWFEDVDISRRLGTLGDVLYVPQAPFEHVGGATAGRLDRAAMVDRHYNGALRYGSKHFAPLPRLGLGALYLLVALIRGVTTRGDAELAAAYATVRRSALSLLRGRPVPPSAP
jgi:N-acetylglucosaminyl-diphospho-decaprenol L-rhamnosyltransferase